MADFICGGTWKSTLKGKNDGTFDLKVDANGKITGDHLLPPNGTPILKVTGTCKHTPNHHIEIKEKRDGKKFRYHADIIEDTSGDGKHKTKDGKRSPDDNIDVKRGKKAEFDDEVWTGVRST